MEEFTTSKEEVTDDEEKAGLISQHKLQLQSNLFKDKEEIKNSLLSLTKFNVVKFKRILQSSFYLLGYCRENICEVNSNRLFWKKAKKLFDESFIEKMVNYNSIGERSQKFELY